jgi:hypothetical protein
MTGMCNHTWVSLIFWVTTLLLLGFYQLNSALWIVDSIIGPAQFWDGMAQIIP